MLHHPTQELEFVVDTPRRNRPAHGRANLRAAFLLIFANQFEVDSPQLDARADKLFHLFEDPPLASDRRFAVCRGFPAKVHPGGFAKRQATLICSSRTPFLDLVAVLLLEILFEGERLGRIIGVSGLLMLSSALIAPTETDVRRAWIPTKSARQCRPFPVFHGECLCQTEQAFGQTREGFSIYAAEVSCWSRRGRGATASLFSLRFPERDGNSTEFLNEKLRQNVTTEAFSGGIGSVSC